MISSFSIQWFAFLWLDIYVIRCLNSFNIANRYLLTILFTEFNWILERAFLVESGTYFGFLLGIVQMLQWAVYPASWTLPVGGAVVGYITNWIALKYIFEPLEPTKVQIILSY